MTYLKVSARHLVWQIITSSIRFVREEFTHIPNTDLSTNMSNRCRLVYPKDLYDAFHDLYLSERLVHMIGIYLSCSLGFVGVAYLQDINLCNKPSLIYRHQIV